MGINELLGFEDTAVWSGWVPENPSGYSKMPGGISQDTLLLSSLYKEPFHFNREGLVFYKGCVPKSLIISLH